ncbi:Succinate dehydrogenase [ubiquinone] cytochrome b small subunit, mitochondrial [Daldinia childiae]|uniref:Succinate dehydrogenase [ubiquinone] cytochrome b small subunit, mitochondrial n=1 Tax=Daldinia childiae TaxID=326645 RepID=UPI001445BB04|nr:Succinate dehydrogenase [ubiquinone] cytochrome b small subunit, mitochondrial [Daldinia childiae]KAF3057312.1 Succinate dehydrogenase [ubiquinone] cytochrome b small subunit, mitochondrial [Daldinia childiae]
MASLARPVLLRQTALAASTRRVATTTFSRQQLIRPTISKDVAQVAAFHASSRRNLLPPGPLNDPAPIPETSPSHGSYHWTFERLVAAGIIPLTIAPFAGGSLNPGLDAILCSLLLVHSHLGFQSVLVDYIPTSRFPKSRKASMWLLNAATALVGVGLYEFETNDVGLTEAVKRVWKAQA